MSPFKPPLMIPSPLPTVRCSGLCGLSGDLERGSSLKGSVSGVGK